MSPSDLEDKIFCEYILNPETGEIEITDKNFKEIDEWPHKWNKKTVTWRLESDTPDIEGRKREEKIIKRGLLRWQLRVKDLKFRMIPKKPGRRFALKYGIHPDMIIHFKLPENDSYLSAEGKENVLAYAYFPGQGELSGDITFNEKYVWSADGKPVNAHKIDPVNYSSDTKTEIKTYNLEHVLIHEAGHAIGLRHDKSTKDSVMYPMYTGKTSLGPRDEERIQSYYGLRSGYDTIVQRLKGYLSREL